MPANIQVVLQQDVDKLGKSGELVRVRPGFARNYLLPRQLAVAATTAAVQRIEHERAVALARAEKAKKEAREVAEQIGASPSPSRTRPATTAASSAPSPRRTSQPPSRPRASRSIDARSRFAESIKSVGTYEFKVALVSDVVATLKVEVVAK